jgi:uncharacterized membrane-anchored protein YhcB (DUF1043 family)
MYYIITFLTALILGFIVGFLFFRNNKEKLQAKEDSGKKLLDALKGR